MAMLLRRRFKLGRGDNNEEVTGYWSGDSFLCRDVIREVFAVLENCPVIWVSLWARPGPNKVKLKYIDRTHLSVDGKKTFMSDTTVGVVRPHITNDVVYAKVEYE